MDELAESNKELNTKSRKQRTKCKDSGKSGHRSSVAGNRDIELGIE